MKNRNNTLTLVAWLCLATAAWAGPDGGAGHHSDGEMPGPGMQGPGPDMHGMMIRHLMHAMGKLDLNEEQEQTIHQLLSDGKEEMHANRVASMENMRAMHDLMQADVLDEGALLEVARQSGELAEARVLAAGRNLHAILNQLDDVQRDQLRAMGEEMRQRHRHDRWHEDGDT